MMKDDNLTDILSSCLDAIEHGERTVEECLALYPEHRSELQALFSTVAAIREGADFVPRPGFRQASRARLLQKLGPRKRAATWQSVRYRRQKTRLVLLKPLAFLRTFVLILLAVFLIGSGTVYASSDALPGDFLYPLKLSTENVRLFVSSDTENLSLTVEFVRIRVEEIGALIENGREENLPLAVDLLSNRINAATESLSVAAREDPERAAQAALILEKALSVHTEVLALQLQRVPEQAKPAIERAIQVSSKGREYVQDMFENELPTGGPPKETPAPDKTKPGGGPPEDVPGPGGSPSDDEPADSSSEPTATHPGSGPPDGVPGPPTWAPGDRPWP
jgi:hypothetical protein